MAIVTEMAAATDSPVVCESEMDEEHSVDENREGAYFSSDSQLLGNEAVDFHMSDEEISIDDESDEFPENTRKRKCKT